MARKYFSVAETAEKLGVSPRRVRALCNAGRLGRRVGPMWVITQSQIDRYQKRGPLTRGPKPKTTK